MTSTTPFSQGKQREKAERLRFGRFFYRFPNGESGADVYDRITSFQNTMIRDVNAGRFASNCSLVLVTHGLALRVFLMSWFHWTGERSCVLRSRHGSAFIYYVLPAPFPSRSHDILSTPSANVVRAVDQFLRVYNPANATPVILDRNYYGWDLTPQGTSWIHTKALYTVSRSARERVRGITDDMCYCNYLHRQGARRF